MTPTESAASKRVRIRRANRADLPAIVRLLADDPLGQGRESAGSELPASYYDAFDEIDRSPQHELVVAELDDRVVGTLQLTMLRDLTYQGGRRAHVEAVRVDGSVRSAGIGARMFEWVEQRARQAGCHLVQLTTNKQRVDAHRFYQRLGYEASHEGMKLDLRRKPN